MPYFFPIIFTLGKCFYHFLRATLGDEALPKWGQLIEEKLPSELIPSQEISPTEKGGRTEYSSIASSKCVFSTLSYISMGEKYVIKLYSFGYMTGLSLFKSNPKQILCNLAIRQAFLFQNNPKYLDPSNKLDPDFVIVLEMKQLWLTTEEKIWHYIYLAIRLGFLLSRMTKNLKINNSVLQNFAYYTTDLDFLNYFGREKPLSYTRRNMVLNHLIEQYLILYQFT